MRRIISTFSAASFAAATVLLPVSGWAAPQHGRSALTTPTPLTHGADAMIRAGAGSFVGSGVRGELQEVRQEIPPFSRAVFVIRVCAVGQTERIRLRGAHSTFTWKVRYRVGRTDVTREVVSGTYRTRRLRSGECRRLRLIVRLQPYQGQYDHVFAVRAIPRSGSSDLVQAAVHITGIIVVP